MELVTYPKYGSAVRFIGKCCRSVVATDRTGNNHKYTMKTLILALVLLFASINPFFSQERYPKGFWESTETTIIALSTTPSLNSLIQKHPKAKFLQLYNYPFDPKRDTLFYAMKHLEFIILDNYPPSTINSVLTNLASHGGIRGLRIQDSLLYDFPTSIRDFNHLNNLEFANVRFHTIPDLYDFTIDTLLLESDSILTIPSEKLKITTLRIFNPKTTFLPQGIENLQELNDLYISAAHPLALEEILQRIPGNNILKNFSFNASKISSVPESIRKLKNLKELDLSANHNLSSLPESLQDLMLLEMLDLASCRFTEFPKILFKLKGLQSVALDENKIRDIGCTFENSPIKKISLFNNPLSEESRILIENTVPPMTKVVYPYEAVSLNVCYNTDKNLESASQITVLANTPSLNDVIRRRPDVTSIKFNNYPFDSKKDTLFFSMIHLTNVTFINYSEEALNTILKMVSLKKSIRSVCINDSLLTSFPTSLHHFAHLDYLGLVNVRFTSILHKRGSLLTVDTLSLQLDSLVLISPNIAKQFKIKSLYIIDSKFNDFPGGFEAMNNLKEIRLSSFPPEALKVMLQRIPEDNQIEHFSWINSTIRSIPISISKLKNLKMLNLESDTLLSLFPNEIGYLYKLEKCNLSRCGFTEFPQVLFALKNLQVVNLASNMIQDIGCTFENTTIKAIVLHGNPLSEESRKILKSTVPSTTKIDPRRR